MQMVVSRHLVELAELEKAYTRTSLQLPRSLLDLLVVLVMCRWLDTTALLVPKAVNTPVLLLAGRLHSGFAS